MNTDFEQILNSIPTVDRQLEPAARAHLDNLTKPVGSLGRLEDLATDLYCMAGGQRPLLVNPVRIFTVAGDHGVVSEGVSPYEQDVTRQMVLNIAKGGAAVSVLARSVGAQLVVVDAGCKGAPFPEQMTLYNRKIAPGTANFTKGPAMSEDQCLRAISLGLDLVAAAEAEGVRTFGIGEMGIGNTTPATALFSAFLGLPPAQITGPGAGLSPEQVPHKARIVERALMANTSAVWTGNPLTILAALGGYEIATMTGIVLGAARGRHACLIDGFIAQAACLAAIKLCPAAAGFAILTHVSAEPGSAQILPFFTRPPLLDLGLRLGEGTGSVLAVPLVRAAAAMFNDMATFSSAGVNGDRVL